MVTIKDIARELGLAVSTVGRALTDHPRISRSTKQRVRSAADRLGYVAHAPARVMRGGTSHLVGLLVPDIRSPFYSMVAQCLSECFVRDGFHLALSITGDDRETELQEVREMLSVRVAGVIVVTTANPRRETLSLLKTIPHVQLLRRNPSLTNWFGLDDERSIRDATEHLFQLGHTRVAFIGDTIYSTGQARWEGFRRVHAEAKRQIEAQLMALGPPTAEYAADAIARLMAVRAPPTAIVTSSVLGTLGAAERLAELGVDIPNTLSFIGFGDGPWEKWWGPGLTTLRLPTEELATSCGLWFLHRLKSKQIGGPAQALVCPTTLIVRGSTAPPRTSSAGKRKARQG
jgi:LacI family transcriptional regulator